MLKWLAIRRSVYCSSWTRPRLCPIFSALQIFNLMCGCSNEACCLLMVLSSVGSLCCKLCCQLESLTDSQHRIMSVFSAIGRHADYQHHYMWLSTPCKCNSAITLYGKKGLPSTNRSIIYIPCQLMVEIYTQCAVSFSRVHPANHIRCQLGAAWCLTPTAFVLMM